jgi:D-methionine transport system ATP-binding protein
MATIVEIKDLSKDFIVNEGILHALKNINLIIEKKDVYGIIGLSGAGKSTLIRCINLLEKPTSGEIYINDVDITKVSKKELLKMRTKIGMIFQNFNLLEQKTVLQNVLFPLEINKVDKETAKAKALELIKLVGLETKANNYPSQLSGGEKQRVAIARALTTNPDVILSDEATSALDPNTTQTILELLKKINREYGITIIVITHEMKVIEQLCDRVAIIDKSNIGEIGNVEEYQYIKKYKREPEKTYEPEKTEEAPAADLYVEEEVVGDVKTDIDVDKVLKSVASTTIDDLLKGFNYGL